MYVKFSTQEEAEEYRQRLQAYHDGQGRQGPRVIDCVVETWDGMFACTLLAGDEAPASDGVLVDTIERLGVEE